MLQNDLKYEGYITRQNATIERTSRMESCMIPADLDYRKLEGLKREAQLTLQQIRPQTLGQAARLHGVTPADIALLSIQLRKHAATGRDDH